MRVLVTGGAGFIGSVLCPKLLERGDEVRVVDCGMFGLDTVHKGVELVVGDVLQFEDQWLEGVDAVIHLAAFSNDPMAEASPSLNYALNTGGTAIVADAAKRMGVKRFVFASSCSVYGLSDEYEVDETFEVKPSFPYAIAKVMAERGLECLEDGNFRPIMLRKGTVVGWSPRVRFDLVTNTMVKAALSMGKITVNNPHLWRPLMDIQDACHAYIRALDADLKVTGIFNIASENFTIGGLADTVAETLREFGVEVTLDIQHRQDFRSYRINMDKAAQILDFHPSVSMADTVRTLYKNLLANDITDFDNPDYYNVKKMQEWMTKVEAGEHDWPTEGRPAVSVLAGHRAQFVKAK